MKKGKTPVLVADEARILLDSIDTSSVMGLRHRALIARGNSNESGRLFCPGTA